MDIHKEFRTDSLSLASYLIASGFPLARFSRHSSKVIFIFLQTSQITEAVNQFQSLSGVIEPQKYFSSIKFLKSILYSKEAQNA